MTGPIPFGSRIAIIGPSNSGKSTLAYTMGRAFNLPVYPLDQYAHVPNSAWIRRPENEFAEDHRQLIAKESWIIEGNYGFLMPDRFHRATTIIWLDPSPTFVMLRYLINRFIKPMDHRHGQLQGGSQTISWGLVRFTLFQYPKNRMQYRHYLSDIPPDRIIHLTSLRQISDFYKKIGLIPNIKKTSE